MDKLAKETTTPQEDTGLTEHTATLREIWIYPIKSTRGIPLTEAKVEGAGLAYDRRWMVVSPDGQFMTAREHPRLLQIATTILPQQLQVEWLGETPIAPLYLPLAPDEQSLSRASVAIWSATCEALDMGEEAASWLSQVMQQPCRLVWMPQPRSVRPDFATVGTGEMSFGDTLPCLVVSQASLDELNRRSPSPVAMERFRPNLIVEDCPPFDEDQWATFTIDGVAFAGVKLCDRCVLTTIEPATGHKGKEPLATLATFRKYGQRVYFGQNAIPQTEGVIAAGQSIHIQTRKVLISFGEVGL